MHLSILLLKGFSGSFWVLAICSLLLWIFIDMSPGALKQDLFLDTCPRVEVLGFKVCKCSIWQERMMNCFPKWLYGYVFPPAMYRSSSPVLGVLILAVDWISHYDVDLYLLEWCWTSLSKFLSHASSSLKYTFESFAHFSVDLLCFVGS